jgi:hypothetical protein
MAGLVMYAVKNGIIDQNVWFIVTHSVT